MSSTPSQHVKRCPHMGHSQTKSQAPRLGVGKPGLWIWLLAGCLETPQTRGGGNWTWVLCFPDGFFLQVSRHSEHSFWFSPHPVGHPPAHSAWQRAQGLTASPSATLWLSATPWLVPPPPSCPGRVASPTRACPPPSLPRQSGISHQGLSVPFLAQAERHLPPGPVSPLPCPGRVASPTRACQSPSLPRQSGIAHQGLSAPILAQAEQHLPPGPVHPHPCPGRAASPTRACQSPPLLDHPQLVSRSLLPVCHPGHGGHALWPPGPGPCLWRTALLLLSPAWLHLRPQWRHPGPPASSDPAVCTPHWPPHLPGVGITRFLETSVPGLTSFHPVCWRRQLPECRGPLTTSPGLT